MKSKPSTGKWGVGSHFGDFGHTVFCDGVVVFNTPMISDIGKHDNDEANARLAAEAGAVYTETGKTPRELAERVKQLEASCAEFAHAELHGETTT